MSDVQTSCWVIAHCLDVTHWSSKFGFIFRNRFERYARRPAGNCEWPKPIRHELDVILSFAGAIKFNVRTAKQKLIGGTDASSHLLLWQNQPGDQDEIRFDWRRRRCCGSFRNSRTGAAGYRRPRLLRAVLPECKLSKPGGGQSVHRWRLLAKRQRAQATACPTSLYGASRIVK